MVRGSYPGRLSPYQIRPEVGDQVLYFERINGATSKAVLAEVIDYGVDKNTWDAPAGKLLISPSYVIETENGEVLRHVKLDSILVINRIMCSG